MSQQPDQAPAPNAEPVPGPDGPVGRTAPPAAGEPATSPSPEQEVAAAVVGAFPEGDADGVAPSELAEVEDDPRTREELLTAAHEAERQRDEYLDDLRRARAEFENFRRRTGRESAAARDSGRGDVAAALLDVLDDLDRTLEAASSSSDQGLAKGVTLVAEKLVGTLRGLGLDRIEPTGQAFDPSQHEAVQQVPADEPTEEPVVESTLRAGYRFGERVLRPAMVVVRG